MIAAGICCVVDAQTASTIDAKPSDVSTRSLQVELPGQENNAIKTSWPGIGCWFWSAEEFEPNGYKRFVDLHEKHSGFTLLTTSIRHPVEVTDPQVHDQIKAAAEYADRRGMKIVMDLDVRLARQAFRDKHPGQLQEIVRLREVALSGAGHVTLSIDSMNLGDHYTFKARGYDALSARVLRVYAYVAGPGGVQADTVADITTRCKTMQADAQGVRLAIPCTGGDEGRTACVLAAFTLFTPDVFAPRLVEFERSILQQYADVPLAGACKDEWGFPGRFDPRTDDLYFSRFMAEAYARRRPGHDLVRDLLRMVKPEKGRPARTAAAINHYMEMNWQRNAAVENAYYDSTKNIFGKEAVVGTHPTWYPYPGNNEIFKNGLDWWAVKRDLAQTDEGTPFSVRTALAKKWHSPLWYNMYYSGAIEPYEENLWRAVLGGGRLNYHPLWPHPWDKLRTSLLGGKLLAAEARVRLLNYISTAPIDCPAAVIFGHPSAMNWAGPGFGDTGMSVANALWAEGFYADLIPSSEITAGNLKLGTDGSLQYGPQHYTAAVLYNPQYERTTVATFFRKAVASGKTTLYRVGDWTMDFDGQALDVATLLPETMSVLDAAGCAREMIAQLKRSAVKPQTTCTMRAAGGFPTSMTPHRYGPCRLLDGTVILASGENDVMGDPIQKTFKIDGHDVTFDAIGVAAVRLDEDGKVEAMAAGGLKLFAASDLRLELSRRIDLALWQDSKSQWHGVLHGWDGPLPAALTRITRDWQRVAGGESGDTIQWH